MKILREEIIKSPDTTRKDRLPPRQRLVKDWPVLHYGSVPLIDTSKWTFALFGLVEKERRLSFQEFQELPGVRIFSDIHCVTGWSRFDNLWEGVSSRTIMDLVHILPAAKYVMVHGEGGFTTNLTLEDFLGTDVLFAFSHNGRDLSPEHGFPLRLLVPRLYFWKSAKWAIGVEFMAEERPGFWESNGYHIRGDPWKEERYGSGRDSR